MYVHLAHNHSCAYASVRAWACVCVITELLTYVYAVQSVCTTRRMRAVFVHLCVAGRFCSLGCCSLGLYLKHGADVAIHADGGVGLDAGRLRME